MRLMNILILLVCLFVFSKQSGIYHENSKITFVPDSDAEYFGYTVVLSDLGLIVGAPKAKSRVRNGVSPGMVYRCDLNSLNESRKVCRPYGMTDEGRDYTTTGRFISTNDFFRNDMWFGATIAPVPHGKLLVCAPRWTTPYKEKFLLANGACYFQTQKRGRTYYPLREPSHQAYITDGKRREYGEYGTHLNFYAYGQSGASIKVVSNNTVIIGAPGLLQWTGGIVDYRYIFDEDTWLMSKQPTTNPYFTKELGPDDYFGYSVESGVFEKNGKILYVGGAPRSKNGYGQVLIFEAAFRETDPLNIKAKLQGPQLGSYFGASLCVLDIDGNGISELLVGAPNYVMRDAGLPYDQGAVFVYTTKSKDVGFSFERTSVVTGSSESGSRFGTCIADLGDIDGDGFRDVAIGAPWENGIGAVYIYKGHGKGLRNQFSQRIHPEGAKGFGISLSSGYDVDDNNCNDLSVGAYVNQTAYIYRCVPSIQVHCSIKVPDAMNLHQNATNFTALFCAEAEPRDLWPNVEIGFSATITIDPEAHRAKLSGKPQYEFTISPGKKLCKEHTVMVEPTADLSKPISMYFQLEAEELLKENSTKFIKEAARITDSSTLHSTFAIQLTRDCGENLICEPQLEMTLEPLNETHVPGSKTKLGARVTILNKREPAYGSKIYLTLPLSPKRVPSGCELKENIVCNAPAPLERMKRVEWEIELDYTMTDSKERELKLLASLSSLGNPDNSTEDTKELTLRIRPKAVFRVSGKSLPNDSIAITREKLNNKDPVTFQHFYEVTNYGPSDWYDAEIQLTIPKMIVLSNDVKGCLNSINSKTVTVYRCLWSVPAKVSVPIMLQLKLDLNRHGDFLEENLLYNVSTLMRLTRQNKTGSVTTRLVLDPAPPVWPLILGVTVGLAILATIVYKLNQRGFFLRRNREQMKRLLDEGSMRELSGGATSQALVAETDESTQELLLDDSD